MGNLGSALQELRAERKQAQSHLEKLDTAISVIESLNGSGTFGRTKQPIRTISAASRRKMAQAQGQDGRGLGVNRSQWLRKRRQQARFL